MAKITNEIKAKGEVKEEVKEVKKIEVIEDVSSTIAGFKKPSITIKVPIYTKESFKQLIEAYKKSNPVKYEVKKAELEKKLNILK